MGYAIKKKYKKNQIRVRKSAQKKSSRIKVKLKYIYIYHVFINLSLPLSPSRYLNLMYFFSIIELIVFLKLSSIVTND